ncbi:hypothetical protein [Acinetobacter modestus]|uniref:hypothetical protein n=1 Tax=Acinetobacter modestus TaxID=1776740 RepID=UPI001F4B331E|nr:hypothetical protein [Acinetobacter modestus]MCH7333671.1 hypothetical protein [Acinetobacter modestus]
MEPQYELIENTCYKEFDGNLLRDYWSFSNSGRYKFTYTLTDLILKYQIKSVSKLQSIVKYSGYLKFTKNLDCGKCNRVFKIYQRKDISFDKANWFKDQLICDSCKREAIDTAVRAQITNFQESLSLIQKYNIEPPSQELGYLEKIFLYVILTTTKISDEHLIQPQKWQEFQALEANGVEYILKGIIDKGYIFVSDIYDDVLIQQNKLKSLSGNLQTYLSFDTERELKKNLTLNFYNDVVIVLPRNCNTKEDLIVKIYNEIVTHQLNLIEIKQIQEFLTIKRLREVYALIDFICKTKNIPLKKNNAFEVDLVRMLKKYNLQYVWSIIFYQAKLTAAKLYDMQFNSNDKVLFAKEHIFSRYISSYLDRLEKNNIDPKFSRNLPNNWIYSEIEFLISSAVLKNYEKWDKFTPDEILALWVEAVGIQKEEIF